MLGSSPEKPLVHPTVECVNLDQLQLRCQFLSQDKNGVSSKFNPRIFRNFCRSSSPWLPQHDGPALTAPLGAGSALARFEIRIGSYYRSSYTCVFSCFVTLVLFLLLRFSFARMLVCSCARPLVRSSARPLLPPPPSRELREMLRNFVEFCKFGVATRRPQHVLSLVSYSSLRLWEPGGGTRPGKRRRRKAHFTNHLLASAASSASSFAASSSSGVRKPMLPL